MSKYIYTQAMRDACPSLCHGCAKAVKPAAESIAEEGWVGCSSMFRDRKSCCDSPEAQMARVIKDLVAKSIASGWVKPAALNDNEEKNVICIYNHVLLVKGCSKCAFFDQKG